jgi:hypothetical protein
MFAGQLQPRVLVLLLGAACMLVACDRDAVYEPRQDVTVEPAGIDAGLFHDGTLRVMTRNLFVGAPVEMIYEPGADIPQAAAELWAWVQATKFEEERADAIADEIKRTKPHVIGLQEVSVFTVVTPCHVGPPFCPPLPAGVVPTIETLNFLEVLLQELGERGLIYIPASIQANFEGAVPMYDLASVTGVSLINLNDFDVVLVRHDVAWDNARAANFARNLEVTLAGMPLTIWRGWASVDVTVDGFAFRFVTTHLEPRHPDPTIQVDQGGELIQILTSWPYEGGQLPTILTGDINSPGDRSSTPTYGNFIDSGFTDVWGPIRPGFTCCQDETLLNRRSLLDRRVDVILMHGDFGRFPALAMRTGHRRWHRTPSGLWPSDHAGVVAWKRLPRHLAVD